MPWQHFSFQFVGPPKQLGWVWVPDPGPGRALAGFAKNEGLGKVKYGGLDLFSVPNGKPPPWIDRYGSEDAQNLVFD